MDTILRYLGEGIIYAPTGWRLGMSYDTMISMHINQFTVYDCGFDIELDDYED